MKNLQFLLACSLLFLSGVLTAQPVYTIKADSVKLTGCDSSELIIENHTQNVPGFLFNTGNGRTIFKRGAQLLSNGNYIIGNDTIVTSPNAWVQGGNSFGATGVLGTRDNNHLDLFTNNTVQARLTNTGNLLLGSNIDGPWRLYVKGNQVVSGNITQESGHIGTLGNGLILDNAVGARIFSYNKIVYQSDATGDQHLFRTDIGPAFTGNLVTIDPGPNNLNSSQLALKVLGTNGNLGLCVNMLGNTGIRTLSPAMALDVNGDAIIRSGQLKLAGGWSGINATCLSTHLYNGCGTVGYLSFGFSNVSGLASGIPDPLTISQQTTYVGIGVINAAAKLQVIGAGSSASTSSFLVNNSSGKEALRITDDGTVRLASLTGDNSQTRVLVADASGNLFYRDAATLADAGGFPSSLAVNGPIAAKRLTLDAKDWPDYVFDSSYLLMPIAELREYVHRNNHLPGVASAAEVGKNGVDVGDTQAALLKKIEELTLYTIAQNKEQEGLRNEVDVLKKEIGMLKELIKEQIRNH